MNNYTNGTIVIAGNSIAELEQELAKVKALMSMGYNCGVGGKSIDEIEKGMKMVGVTPSCCPCNCNCECEDDDLYDEEYEDEDEWEDYEDEDEEEDISELITDIIDKVEDLKDILKR